MTSLSDLASPLWKYGAREPRPRRFGTLNLPRSANLPVRSARPGSVVVTYAPGLLFGPMTYFGKPARFPASGLFARKGSLTPVFMRRLNEWLPTSGVLWHVVQNPLMVGRFESFKPATPVMRMGLV